MPVIPGTQLTLLRSQRPHTARVSWHLAVAPFGDACFTALANDLPPGTLVRGTMTVPYDNDAGEANVLPGMTLWVSAIGYNQYEVGRVRIKAIDTVANTLTVAENSEIEWTDDLFLTCPGAYGFRELWGKYPRIVDGTPVEFYMDYDDNFNSPTDTVVPPKANAGPPAVAWIDPITGNADVSFTGDTSYTTELAPAAIASYLWDYADGAVIVGNVALPGTCAAPNVVRWREPGFRYISLMVTDNTAQARQGIVYVPVWIFGTSLDTGAVQEPFTQVEVLRQDGDTDRGWTAKVKVFRTNTAAEDAIYHFPDGALVVLFTRTWFGSTETGVGGWCMAGDKHYRDNVRFVGWLQGETLAYDYAAGTVEFEAVSHDSIMRLIPGWPFSIESTAGVPVDWYEVASLNVDRALHFLLEYYSTVNEVCDVERVGEGIARLVNIQKFTGESLYDQAQGDLLGDAKCCLLSDRQGILYAKRDPQFMSALDRLGVDVACHLQQALGDWMGRIDFDRQHRPQIGAVRLGGFANTTPLLARAPGAAPLQNAREERVNGCILQNQGEANLWAGLTLTFENNPYPKVPLNLTGYWPTFDPAYQEYVWLTADDPLDRADWTAETFVVREVQFDDKSKDGTCLTSLVLEKATDILMGETVTVPVEPTPAAPLPPTSPLPSPWLPWTGPIKMLIAWDKGWVGWTADFLRHHVSSTATAGTGPADLYDTATNFTALGVAVGDTVENMTSGAYEHTTVSGLDPLNPNHITLTANINLVATNAYHICGTEWVNVGPALAAHEFYIQFIPVRTGADTVGGWLLTGWDGTNPVQGSVYWAPDVLTATPAWSEVLTIETVRAFHANLADANFKAIAVNAATPGYAIVSFDPQLGNSGFGAVYTSNYGAAWSYSAFPAINPDWANGASYFGIVVNQINGLIYTSRECNAANPNRFGRMLVSANAGATFTWTGVAFAFDLDQNARDDFYIPYQNSDIYMAVGTWNALPFYRSPMKFSGGAYTALSVPVGMEYVWVQSYKCGMTGWYGDQLDILTMWHEAGAASYHYHLQRSDDGGTSWTDLGGVPTFFDDIPGAWAGNAAIAHQVWNPDPNVVLWVGMPASGTGGHHQCRIRYTDDDGLTWFNKMGNWYLVFGSWAGAQGSSGKAGTVGAVGLPRLGANA